MFWLRGTSGLAFSSGEYARIILDQVLSNAHYRGSFASGFPLSFRSRDNEYRLKEQMRALVMLLESKNFWCISTIIESRER